jgi:hypothetical protein
LFPAVLALLAAAAAAQEKAAPPPAAAKDAAPPRVQMEEVEIRGELERPEVFYIIPRREVRMDLGPLSKDYRAEILEPLLPGPFEASVRGTRRAPDTTHTTTPAGPGPAAEPERGSPR